MTDELIQALNIIVGFFDSITPESSKEQINVGVLVSNHLELIQSKFVQNVIRPRIHEQIVKDAQKE